MGFVRKITWIKAVLLSFIKLNTRIAIFISILAYVLFGNQITAAKIFVLFSLYDLIKLSLVEFFPLAIMSVMEAKVTLKRIEEFLLLPEVVNKKNINSDINIEEKGTTLTLKNMNFSWNTSKEMKTDTDVIFGLKNISLKVFIFTKYIFVVLFHNL